MHSHNQTYPPLNTIKPICDDVWIVDGPLIRFGPAWAKMPFPTRMTIIRLSNGDLWVHSPTQLTDELQAQVSALGVVRWIVGPNKIHYWWIPQWHAAFPQAGVYLAPGIRERAGEHIAFECETLQDRSGYPWDADIETLPIKGSFMTEVDFFHSASRTLVLTDLIENFEPQKQPFWMRLLTKLGGVADPDGQMPRDMRMTFSKQKAVLRQAVEQMIAWEPERVILAHGRWYNSDGAAELRRAFRWLLD